MEKSLVVVGGFDDRALEDAEALVQQMMVGIAGFKGLNMIDVEQLLVLLILSNFDTPASALKIIRSPYIYIYISSGLQKIDPKQKGFDAKL